MMSPLNKLKEDFSVIENLLNYIPYNKLLDLSNDEQFKAFLVYVSGKNSLIPELAKILPPKILLEFLFIFSGQELGIPEKKSVITAFRDIDIYFCLEKTPTIAEMTRLAGKYNTTPQTVKAVSDRVSFTLGKPAPIK
jgi:hypothetical protein